MAIEFIPKPKAKIPSWTVIVFVICGILLLGGGGSYFYLIHSSKKISEEIQERTGALMKTPEEAALEEELLLEERKINSFVDLISARQKTVNLFDFLEKTCHPKVWFSNFGFNSQEEIVNVKGKTTSFVALGQQILIFRKEPILKKINLTEVSMKDGGEIEFSLQLTFDPQVFK